MKFLETYQDSSEPIRSMTVVLWKRLDYDDENIFPQFRDFVAHANPEVQIQTVENQGYKGELNFALGNAKCIAQFAPFYVPSY